MKERPNISNFGGTELAGVAEALRRGQTDIASQIIGAHVHRIQGPLPGKPQEVPQQRIPECRKKHIKQSGK